MTLNIRIHFIECHYAECHYVECGVSFIVMLNDIMLKVVILSVIMPDVIMLSVVLMSVVAPYHQPTYVHCFMPDISIYLISSLNSPANDGSSLVCRDQPGVSVVTTFLSSSQTLCKNKLECLSLTNLFLFQSKTSKKGHSLPK